MKQKVNEDILNIVSTVIQVVFKSIFFITLIVNLFWHSIINFYIIVVSIILFCCFSENICGSVIIVFTVIASILDAVFIRHWWEVHSVLAEYGAIVCLYLILEMYRNKYISLKSSFFEMYCTLDREIISKNCEIYENKKSIADLKQHIRNFKKISRVLYSFQALFDEKKIIKKSEDIAHKFIGKGFWKMKKYSGEDIFAFYMKNTSLPLMIADMSTEKRFSPEKNNEVMSLIAAPIEFNGIFWGTLQGSSGIKNFFSEEDLRQLSLLSGIVNTVLNNSYLYKQLQSLAVTDGLTGLYTQIYFKEILIGELGRCRTNKLPLSLGILDVDFFKDINDKYGHQAGDSILHQISSLLCAKLRETDFIARYGGEEFAFIMLHTNSEEAAKILEQIRLNIERQEFLLPVKSLSPVQIKITVSIGFVSLDRSFPVSEEKFIKNADAALYRAKRLGRNRVEEFLGG
jgi:diguanylate cyclase (GGDEF)-like protein